jgi:hypothetical protein
MLVTTVTPIRTTNVLAQAVRDEAAERKMSQSAFMGWLLGIALQGAGLDISVLSDVKEQSDCKLQFRLSDELLSQLRSVCERFRVSHSVYIRTILHACHTGQLKLTRAGDRYTLVAKNDKN